MPLELQGWDPDFFDAFRKGEEQAFDRVFRAYHGPLTFFAFKYLQDEKQAEDIVQDCFAELWERRHHLAEVQSIRSYLYRCVYNHCSKFLGKILQKRARPEIPTEPEQTDIVESEIMMQVLQVIELLPSRMKQVLQMHYLEDKSLEEIGKAIGISSETARSHRYRAIQLIRKTIITG